MLLNLPEYEEYFNTYSLKYKKKNTNVTLYYMIFCLDSLKCEIILYKWLCMERKDEGFEGKTWLQNKGYSQGSYKIITW